MTNPKDLPENLQSVRDEAIDFAYGRLKSEPADIQMLYDWLEIDGWDALVGTESEEDLAVDILWLSEKFFTDQQLEDWEGINPEGITDELRLKFARERLENIFDEDEFLVKSICAAYLENNKTESAYICAVLESQGQAGMAVEWCGIFKTFADFQESIRQSEGLVLMDDCPNLPNEAILKLWHNE